MSGFNLYSAGKELSGGPVFTQGSSGVSSTGVGNNRATSTNNKESKE